MYQLIYDFLADNLFNGADLNNYSSTIMNQTMNMNEWLCHTFSIISIALIFIFCVIFVKWFFKLGAGLFRF